MDTQGKTKEVLTKESHKLHKEYDLLKTAYSKEIIIRKQTEKTLKECENNLKERIKELNGIYSLGNLAEKLDSLEDIYKSFVNNVVPESMQFPEKVFVSLEIGRKVYSNIDNFKLLKRQKYLSAPIKIYGKQVGELIVTYTEDLSFIDFYELNLIKNYAERISRISERIKTQQILEESEEKFRFIFENSADSIFILNQEGKYLYTNKAVSTMLGYTSKEMESKTIADISPPTRIKEYFEMFMQILNEGKIFAEFELLKKDGNCIPTDINAVLLPNGQVYGSCRDITERKQTEKVLKESESALRFAQVTGKIGSWEWDLVTQKTIWSDNNFAILGLNSTQAEASFELFRSRIHPDDTHIIDETHLKIMQDKLPVIFELRLVEPDGTIKWIQNNISLVIEDNTPIKLKGVIIDISNLKKTELQLKEDEKQLHQLNIDKDKFISILSHDLKSPLNNLLGLSEVLTEGIHKLKTDEIEAVAKDIYHSAKITNKLLEDLLMWARTQQGKIPFKLQNLSFTGICNDAIEALNPNAIAKHITINHSPLDEIWIFADLDMIKTVLRNLVSNAIKFTNTGGTIRITAEQKDSIVTISVADNGIGIAPDDLVKLFDISEVITTKGTAKETGTGLGLLLCKEFVEKHGGKIWVDSEVNKGSDFKFALPAGLSVRNLKN